jgi:hypothetical protein
MFMEKMLPHIWRNRSSGAAAVPGSPFTKENIIHIRGSLVLLSIGHVGEGLPTHHTLRVAEYFSQQLGFQGLGSNPSFGLEYDTRCFLVLWGGGGSLGVDDTG